MQEEGRDEEQSMGESERKGWQEDGMLFGVVRPFDMRVEGIGVSMQGMRSGRVEAWRKEEAKEEEEEEEEERSSRAR